MNIIFTPQSYKDFQIERKEANKGCYICPCCGEYRQAFIYDMLGKNYGMMRTGIDIHTERRQIDEGVYASFDCFRCNSCKAMWESEPFDFDEEWTDTGNVWYDGDHLDDDDSDVIYMDIDNE